QLGGPIEGTFGKKEAVKCTYFVTTRGNAGFEIGGSWWEDVTGVKKAHVAGDVTFGYDANLTVEVGGNLTEKVGGARTETTKSFTMQTYTGAHEMWAKSGRLDEISSLHVTLGLSDVTDTVTGTLDQSVGGLSLEVYLSGLETKSKGISLEAPVIAIITPSDITMEPKNVVHKGLWIKITPRLLEAYVGKAAAGAAKVDVTGASASAAGKKVDVTGVAVGHASSKNDFTGAKVVAVGFAFKIGNKPVEETAVFKGDGGLRSLVVGALTYH
ncbi:MAG: hypothetical protein IT373_14630, partial [Polyangiaceae bacterium]|nr:hypothetical protein [Polyangiaceae bacterium]